jgi:hypothetical protein
MLQEGTRDALERISNDFSRRTFLEKGAKFIFATLAAVAAGQLELKPALASYLCCAATSVQCPNCPPLQTGGCPSGYVSCTGGQGCPYCYYPTGCWSCLYMGSVYVDCCDCWKQGQCNTACTCGHTTHCCSTEQEALLARYN